MITESYEEQFHIYRARKHIRIAYNTDWVFQYGCGNTWFVGFAAELSYGVIEELDFEYIGHMSREDFERVVV